MSIVNISSENKISGNDADFVVKLKKTMMRAVGIQILNVSIPLSYQIINIDNNKLNYYRGSHKTMTITPGSYSADALAFELTRQFQIDDSQTKLISQEQYDLHKRSRSNKIQIRKALSVNQYRDDGTEAEFTTSRVGKWVASSSSYVELGSNDSLDLQITPVVVFYDEEGDKFVFVANGMLKIYGYEVASGGHLNDLRVLKTIGLNNKEYIESVASNTITGKWTNINDPSGGHYLDSDISPEISGPSLIYLRLGGDILMDQQNTESNNNDRIPIPIDQPHGGIVHYETADKADLIPLSIPCDVSTIKIKLEAGDTNEVIGGPTNNLRGHHTEMRLKFYFAHGGGAGPKNDTRRIRSGYMR